ncbi:hypothetical protein BH20CHL6_BH20CHL6_13710 [soil metagenome]
MTAMAGSRSRPSLPVPVLVGLTLAAVIAVLFVTGVVGTDKWLPFLDPVTMRFFAEGLLLTLTIGSVSLVASLALGIPMGIARTALPKPLRWLLGAWIEAVRATPVLAILLITLVVLGRMGMPRAGFQAAIIGLTLYTSAVLAVIVSAGIASIPRGEVDAARSLGLGYGATMRYVVLPQALARMMPAIVSQLITLIKDTSLASIIGVFELVRHAQVFYVPFGNPMQTYLVIGLMFFLICYPLSLISRRLEARQPVSERVIVIGEEDQLATAVSAR